MMFISYKVRGHKDRRYACLMHPASLFRLKKIRPSTHDIIDEDQKISDTISKWAKQLFAKKIPKDEVDLVFDEYSKKVNRLIKKYEVI